MAAFSFLCLLAAIHGSTAMLSKRFEYKYSFKGPHLVQKDRTVPFWNYVGNAIASDDFVRLAPSLKSQRGLIWNKVVTDFDNWEVEITFKVAGRGRVGADGLAFWYTMENEGMTGPVFGSRDNWRGLGIFFDSFDNDAQNNNPYISAHTNDGNVKFDHQSDGSVSQLGGCMRDYRNKPYPVKAKIRYENKVLSIYTSSGLTKNAAQDDTSEHMYDLCAYVPNVELARGGHFAVSAATGAVADDHDVISLITHSLRTEDEMKSKQAIADDERAKYDKEFEQFDKELNEAKDEYQKENPDAAAAANKEDTGDEYYDNNVRELRMIFEGQDHIHQSINAINRRLNELLGVSQQINTLVGQIQQQGGGAAAVAHQDGGGPAPAATSSIQRHEVDHLIRSSNDLMQELNNLKITVDSISRGKRDTPQVPTFADKNTHQLSDNVNEMKVLLKQMASDTQAAQQRGGGAGAAAPANCPTISCVSTLYFGALIAGQIIVLALYNFYNSRKEAAAKKFY